MKPEEVLKVLAVDPIGEAEKITGKSYKEDEATDSLGMLMHLMHGERKRNMLNDIGDTGFGNKVSEYLRKVQSIGFEIVLEEEFFSESSERDEKFYVLFNYALGILLAFDTFWGQESVNGGSYWYNWSPNSMESRFGLTSSGGFYFPVKSGHIGLLNDDNSDFFILDYPANIKWNMDNMTHEQFRKLQDPIDLQQDQLVKDAMSAGKRILWIGYHDCREGVLSHIAAMQNAGKFLSFWKEPYSCLWLDHHGDKCKDGSDFDRVTKERIERLPEQVRKQIGL